MRARKKIQARRATPRRRSTSLNVRLARDVHEGLQRIASFAGVSLDNTIRLALAQQLLRQPSPPKEVPVLREASGPRFINVGADGKSTTGEHVAVYDQKTGLTWTAYPLQDGKDLNHADAMKACGEVDLFGHADWRAPTIEELLSIIDYSRNDPAVDPAHFKGPYGWTWTSTPYKGSSGDAWDVGLRDGDSDWNSQDNHYHVRAVRAGQPLGLLG
jgi:hypothetical protein